MTKPNEHCGICGVPLPTCMCVIAANAYPPGGTPAGIVPAPHTPGVGGSMVPAGTPSPFVPQGAPPAPVATPTARPVISRGGYLICPICDLALMYCRGHTPPSPAAADGADSSLQRRIADARRDAGGR